MLKYAGKVTIQKIVNKNYTKYLSKYYFLNKHANSSSVTRIFLQTSIYPLLLHLDSINNNFSTYNENWYLLKCAF